VSRPTSACAQLINRSPALTVSNDGRSQLSRHRARYVPVCRPRLHKYGPHQQRAVRRKGRRNRAPPRAQHSSHKFPVYTCDATWLSNTFPRSLVLFLRPDSPHSSVITPQCYRSLHWIPMVKVWRLLLFNGRICRSRDQGGSSLAVRSPLRNKLLWSQPVQSLEFPTEMTPII
jgi:hypothetical protein